MNANEYCFLVLTSIVSFIGIMLIFLGFFRIKKLGSSKQHVKIEKLGIELDVTPGFGICIIGTFFIIFGFWGLQKSISNSGEKITDDQVNLIIESVLKNTYSYYIKMPYEIATLKKDQREKLIEILTHNVNLQNSSDTKISQTYIDYDYLAQHNLIKVIINQYKRGDRFYFRLVYNSKNGATEYNSDPITIPEANIELHQQ
jgi:hypothetical protein